MKTEAYKEWTNLYTDEVGDIWNNEKGELKKTAMILFVIQREFKRIQNDLEKRHMQFQIEYDDLEREKLENLSTKSTVNNEGQTNIFEKTTLLQSPTPKSPKKKSPRGKENQLEDVNESSDDTICASPKLSRQKYLRGKKPVFLGHRDNLLTKSSQPLQPKHSCDTKTKAVISNFCDTARNPLTPKPLQQCVDDLIDCSMIGGTPNVTSNSKKLRSRIMHGVLKKSKMKKSSSNNATLTQMFFTDSRSPVTESNSGSVSKDASNKNILLEDVGNIINDTFFEDNNFKPPKEIICKEPVVRGKDRLKLEGWDCEECRAFYEGLNLNTQDIKSLLNKCSRHRATRKPEDYTPPGYWTLAFSPTQKANNSGAEVQTLTEQSTFFQF